MSSDQEVINSTRCWIETVVVRNGFCPFAAAELARDSILYSVVRSSDIEPCLEALIELCRRVEEDAHSETAFLVFPETFGDFRAYLDFVDLAERLLRMQDYEGVYQLASFHPDYCFDGATDDDPANYTNRSPYPMLHLLREAGIERVLSRYREPESIPDRNIENARRLGLAALQAMLSACRNGKGDV